ncbi:MAG: DUF58 domain-containing protein [Nitrososphaerota archaeon]
MFTARGYYISTIAILSVALGAFFYLPAISMVSLPAVIFILMARVAFPLHTEVDVTRLVERKVILQGDTLSIKLKIQNNGERLAVVKVTDELPSNMELVDGSNVILLGLKNNETKSFNFSLSASLPGRYMLSKISIEVMDPLQIFHKRKIIQTYEEIRAYPFVETSRHSILMLSLRNEPGENRSRRQGEGEEFYSVRNYVPGDRLRRINWKASARYSALFTNQYTSELAGELMIVLDSRFALLAEDDEKVQFRFCSSAAATIAYSSLMSRNKVGLMIMGDLLEKVPPAYGFKQLRKILAALSDFRAGRRWQISKVNSYLRLLFPKVNEVTIITPLADVEILDSVSALHEDGFNTLVVAPDIWSERIGRLKDRERRIATKLFIQNRKVFLNQVRKYATVVDWDIAIPISHSMRNVEAKVGFG